MVGKENEALIFVLIFYGKMLISGVGVDENCFKIEFWNVLVYILKFCYGSWLFIRNVLFYRNVSC